MKKRTVFHTIRVMLPMAYHASDKARGASWRFWAVNMLGILQSGVLAVNTVLLAKFVDALIEAAGNRRAGSELLLWTALYVAGMIGHQLLNTFFNYILGEYTQICRENFHSAYHRVAAGLAPIAFESSAALDEMKKAEAGLNSAGAFVFHLIGILDMVPPYLIFLSVYVTRLNVWLLICIAAAFLPSAFTLYMQRHIYSEFADTAAPLRRRYEAYKDCVTDRQYFKETRILRAGSFFLSKAAREWKKLCREEIRVKDKSNLLNLLQNTVSLAGYLGALVVLVVSVLNGSVSVGAFAAVYNSLNELFDMMFSLVCGFIGSTVSELPQVENYVRFLEQGVEGTVRRESGEALRGNARMENGEALRGNVRPENGEALRGNARMENGEALRGNARPENGEALSGSDKEIVLEGVSFTYPDAGRLSIKDVSIRIPVGQHVAIVGENGAGKSTLAKLLLCIYPPDSGRIRIRGVDTGTAAPEICQKYMSSVFQNFGRYQMTLSENVRISDFAGTREPGELLKDTGLDRDKIQNCADVMLSREFGGIELSGGLWQQVAIARGKYREHEIIVLDEPTAALDPVTESEVYHRFLETVRGKTAFIVSHRLGSARLADRILVMQEGRLAEEGTHEELLQRGGLYRKMWEAQAEGYQNSV